MSEISPTLVASERTSGALWLFPTATAFVFGLVFWAALLIGPSMMNTDGDLGRHITVGQTILDTGSIPTADLFSHTMTGRLLVPHEWLSQVLFALAHGAAGLNGVVWLTAGVLASTYALVVARMRQDGTRAPLTLAGGMLAFVVGYLHALTRPHIWTLLFFALFLLLLEQFRREGRAPRLLVLLPLMVVWANLHGAFVTGVVLVLLYAVGAAMEREWRKAGLLAATVLLLVLASWLNPVGSALLPHSFAYLGERFLVDMTVEYQSPDFHSVSTWPFAALVLGSLGFGWLSGRRLAWTPLLLLGVWTAFGLYSARHIPLYGLVAVPILGRELDGWLDSAAPRLAASFTNITALDRQSWGWMWVTGGVALAIGLQASGVVWDVQRQGNRFSPSVFPVAAVDALEGRLPEGRMFNEFAWGGYLLYRLWPEQQVFIDAQTDFYGEALSREFLQVADAQPGWEAVLERHRVSWVIVPRSRPLASRLQDSPEWESVYEDGQTAVWQRR